MIELKAIAIVIAVMIDRWVQYIPGGKFILQWRSINWLSAYVDKAMNLIANTGVTQGYLILAALFAPLALALLLLQLILVLLFGGIGKLLFVTLPLLYFLGNREVEANESEFIMAHENSFGILFWFALLGPIGALMYWFFVALHKTNLINNPQVYKALNFLHALAAWIPARITGFVYVLVGNFSAGFRCWLESIRVPTMQSSQLLEDCGEASADASIIDDDKNLVTRAFIAWVVISILIVICQ